MTSRIRGSSSFDRGEPSHRTNITSKEDVERRMGELGGCTFDPTVQAYIPIHPERVDQAWLAQKELLREKIGPVYPKDSREMGSWFWQNTAISIDDLFVHATQAAPFFKSFMEEIATAISGRTYFGEKDKHIVKTRASIEEKVKKIITEQTKYGQSFSERDAVITLNDSLRGTIIIDSIPQCLTTLNMLRNECAIVHYDLVFSNKFDANYPNGYVGIHAKVVYKYTFSGQKRSVVSEVQIHFNAIEDGTPSCPSQSTHGLYEESRKILSQDDESKARKEKLDAAIKLQFLIGMEKIA